ncbi:HK97 family phage prohead protease [Streptomyces sp. JB150]|uniref:HK97 family phage prohead protease n=1 Tax=Streptomyces sp. JB150 TaxID=2714844 RepID=UPI001F0E5368|nr:HK97 family phage prohead protease [Streptomyces sp. JB150]
MSALTMQAAPRDGLLRSVPFHLARADGDTDGEGDGLTLEGYAAVFDAPTEIDSWEGTFTEKIRRGAFRKTIREGSPVLQFDHGRHPLIGSIPIGAIETLSEDDQGLYVRARLSDNWLIQPVRDAIAERSIKGMSFRFTVIREEWRDNAGKLVKPEELGRLLWDPGDRGPLERTLIEVRMPELGPVVFPAYTQTTVDVRARGVAELIGQDRDLVREVRASLARAATPRPKPGIEDLRDPDVRRDVARALLFGPDADTPEEGVSGPPATAAPPDTGHLADRTTATPGAPLAEEHPPQNPDAPLATEHPSPSPRSSRLRDQIREITGLMDEQLARIAQRQTTDGAQSLAGGNPPEGHQGRA